ncbi:MAG: thiamine pyrophosphate-binding protein [Rhizobiaceae bacterium]|nr:thiamine pyrophosphate-binding protein [Rhizobiaceae bacterium]
MDSEGGSSGGPRTGARILVDQLVRQGVECATCVPGESYLSVLDCLLDTDIDLITCRHEGGAAMMAEAYGKLTGNPGICFVTRGPGATNAAAGVHVASQDSTPMILFVGQVARDMRHREAFQELDYRAVFGSICKWVVEIDDAARIPELVARAFRVALQGRPGPVVIALPEDMLDDLAVVTDACSIVAADCAPTAGDMETFAARLEESERPIIIVGGSRWTEEASDGLTHFAEEWKVPLAVSYRRGGLVSSRSESFAGDLSIGANPALTEAIKASDLVILLGTRLSEIASGGYTLAEIPGAANGLVHIHPDPDEIGRVYQPEIGIVSTPAAFVSAIMRRKRDASRDEQWRSELRASYLNWSGKPLSNPGAFQMADMVCWLRDNLPDDAIITNGAGNFAAWIHRYYRFRSFRSYVAPTSGSMGYGLPAGVMAKRQYPDRTVVTVAGDGDLMMTAQEFATAVHHGIPLIVVVIDNGIFGTIRMHQEREFPGRVSATDVSNPDFVAWAKSHDAFAERIEDSSSFPDAFGRAAASGRPALLHCILDPEAIAPTATISGLRKAAREKSHQEEDRRIPTHV